MILQDTLLNSMVSQKDISKCLIKQSGECQGYIPITVQVYVKVT